MKRPVGVTLASILLGLFASIALLLAAGTAFLAASLAHHGVAPPTGPALPSSFFSWILVLEALVTAAFAGWAIATLIGLLRLRNWARLSILVIGAIIVFLAVCGVLGAAFGYVAQAALPPDPRLPPHLFAITFAVMAAINAAIAGLGAWWLIYFTRPRLRELFKPSGLHPDALPTAPGRFSHVPPAILVIACLFALSALSCAAMMFLPLPGFLFGFIIHGSATHIVYLALALLSAFIAYGLLQLDNRARLAVLTLLGLGSLNIALTLLPWYRAQFRAYNQQVLERFQLAGTPAFPAPDFTRVYLAAGLVFGLASYGLIFWLVERHRQAFLRPPPPRP